MKLHLVSELFDDDLSTIIQHLDTPKPDLKMTLDLDKDREEGESLLNSDTETGFIKGRCIGENTIYL